MYEQEPEKELTPQEKIASALGSVGKFILSFVETIVVALVISVVIYLFVMTPHEVVGQSMHPTYQNGEMLMANKITYKVGKPKRGDVIIFKYSETQDFIKRIIGLPGDTVMLKDGKLYINSTLLDESHYLQSSVYTNGGQYLTEGEQVTVPEGRYFVCGDNRPHSSDSRAFGPIDEKDIKGKAWIVYYPFANFRLVKHEIYQGF
ncbi:TPA: signal peptidase I [Candidatus Dojkabacteria bacterium]|jgi:signal peptidase I|uniref:Signal peptidase I n=1 Tax=Candidatus Dojkabacteria bacterium TaxID=2099670 RepID=A0A832QC68_9BACT|nr:signal peptidase I [Candidatus Dojkabacteria bacterium]